MEQTLTTNWHTGTTQIGGLVISIRRCDQRLTDRKRDQELHYSNGPINAEGNLTRAPTLILRWKNLKVLEKLLHRQNKITIALFTPRLNLLTRNEENNRVPCETQNVKMTEMRNRFHFEDR